MGTTVKQFFNHLFKTGFFSIFFSTILVKVFSFCQSIIVVHFLSKIEYGLYAYCNNLMSMILLFDGLGCINGILQFCSEHFGDTAKKNAFYIFGVKMNIFTNIITCILIVIIAFTMNFEIEGAKEIMLIMCLHPLLMGIYNLTAMNLRVNFKNKQYSFLNAFYCILTSVLIVVFAYFWKVKGIAFSNYIILTLSIILSLILNRQYLSEIRHHGKLEKKEKLAFIKHSVFVSFSHASSQLMLMLDIFVIGMVITDELVLADYKVASTIPTALYFIPQTLMIYYYPYFVNRLNKADWLKKSVPIVFIAQFIISFLIGIILIIFSKFFLGFLFGEQYITASPIFIVLIISFIIGSTMKIISSNLLTAYKKTTFIFIFSIVEGVVNIGLNYLLVPLQGSIGAAYATLAVTTFSSFVQFIYVIVLLTKHIKKLEKENVEKSQIKNNDIE